MKIFKIFRFYHVRTLGFHFENEQGHWFGSNCLSSEVRYWGYQRDYFDGPVHCFGFWFFHVYCR